MRLFTYIALATMISACGEISYKQGGSAQDIERAHQACRGSGEQFKQCLAEHGWQKPQTDLFDPLFATVSVTDNRNPAPQTAMIIEPEPQKASAKPQEIAVATVAENTKKSSTTSADNSKPMPIAPANPRATIHDGPDVEYSINSWWKMGAFPDHLAKDQRSCEQTLGPNYLPDYKTQTYKRKFVACMHDQGWMAVRNVK